MKKGSNHKLCLSKERLIGNDSMVLEVSNIKQNYIIAFQTRIQSFDKLIISHGKDQKYSSSFLVLDERNVSSYFYTTEEEMQECYSHDLKITGNVSVVIGVKDNLTADVIIAAGEKIFRCNITWKGCTGTIMAESKNSNLTHCMLTFYCSDYDKKIWGFGDSYFGRWPQVLNEWGYANWMVDGYSGRKTKDALTSLEKCLLFGTPQKIIWAMGMNDADSPEEINSEWMTTQKKLESICEREGIELIMVMTPNVPNYKNIHKNDYIRTSGYRFVDLNTAVGADIDTKWNAGLLDGDMVHPTDAGSKRIALAVVVGIPELRS